MGVFQNSNYGISPAVGVILLIGITVSIATISSFVLLGFSQPQTVSASGVDITENPEGVEVTWSESGTSDKIEVLVDGEKIVDLKEVNDSVIIGTEKDSKISVVGVSEDGDKNTFTETTTDMNTTEDGTTDTTIIETNGFTIEPEPMFINT